MACAGVSLLLLLAAALVSGRSHSHQLFPHDVARPQGRQHDYGDALSKCILFFEGQRSGKLPSSHRMTWRNDSALQDGQYIGVDLAGGYYDAGDNIKFGFPMAFSITVLAWGSIVFGGNMGPELGHAAEAIRWGTDYLLKATAEPNKVYVQVADPYNDHNCWERPEDMDTNRTVAWVDAQHPGSEVAGETAAALAASSIFFRSSDPGYAETLLNRSKQVYDFADKHRGSYNDSLAYFVCPFYCDFSGYEDELVWGAAWLYKATNDSKYLKYISENVYKIDSIEGSPGEFGWDDKHAGIAVLLSDVDAEFHERANVFVCTVLPDSPTKAVSYSPGGLMFKPGGSNMQHPTALSFLLVVLAGHLSLPDHVFRCDGGIEASPASLIQLAKSQVDYILGDNPLSMSYMVGYGDKFPQRIHHRGSSLPSIGDHPERIGCKDGVPFYESNSPNPNLLIGALVGGPDAKDAYPDSRSDFVQSEPTTYLNAPMVGVLAYFSAHG